MNFLQNILPLDNTILGLSPAVFWVIISLAIVTFIAVIVIVILAVRFNRAKKQGQNKNRKAPKVKVVKNVRYSAEESHIENNNGAANVTHLGGDITLLQGKLYTARRNGKLLPGKYTMLSTSEGQEQFNVRIGRYMRTYTHGDTIVLAENETIICHSHPIMLR